MQHYDLSNPINVPRPVLYRDLASYKDIMNLEGSDHMESASSLLDQEHIKLWNPSKQNVNNASQNYQNTIMRQGDWLPQ